MPRSLEFQFNGSSFVCDLLTVDRKKLYGSITTETLDINGNPCELATLAVDGKTLIPYGGTASGYVNGDGDWISRKDLTAVDEDNNPLPEIESSFDAPIVLEQTVSIEAFLDHSVRLVYLLTPQADLDDSFTASVDDGTIYRFDFSYRGGTDTDPAFVLLAEDKQLWMLVTDQNDIDYVSLEQAAICSHNSQQDSDEAEESDEIDFSML